MTSSLSITIPATAVGRALSGIRAKCLDACTIKKHAYQGVRIRACASAVNVQSLGQTIKEADAFGRAALPGEIGTGAVGEFGIIGGGAGGAEAVDCLKGREREGGDCLKRMK